MTKHNSTPGVKVDTVTFDAGSFAARCRIAQECLPDAEYRTRLTTLHNEMLSALGVDLPDAPFATDRLEQVIDGYAADYEFNDGEAFHAPNEQERALIKDAIMGLLGYPDWDEEWGKLIEQRVRERTAGVLGTQGGNDGR